MEENKFERQVRQKMDELKIHPSESVWKKIEGRLEKKTRSNRGLFLFALLFFVLLTGGYLLWNSVQRPGARINDADKTTSEKNTKKIPVKENKNSQAPTSYVAGSASQKNTAVGNVALKGNFNKKASQHHNKVSSDAKISVKINPGEKATAVFSKQQEVKDAISENTNNRPAIAQPVEIQSENEQIKVEAGDAAPDKLSTTDNVSKLPSSPVENPKVANTLKEEAIPDKTVKHSRRNKWKPGLLFSAGISGVGSNFLGLVNTSPYDYMNFASQGPTPVNSVPPSGTRSAFGFMAGIVAERNISTKIKLVTGINFKSFNTSNKVGASTGIARFYNSQNLVNTYRNHYNFIELPLALKIGIGKGKNMPFVWQGGLVISELVSSNALQFNSLSGLYYTNNSIFNKTQFGLNTSFSVALFSKQKASVLIGPYFYYSASKLANEGLYNKKHFVFTGLRTEIIFGR